MKLYDLYIPNQENKEIIEKSIAKINASGREIFVVETLNGAFMKIDYPGSKIYLDGKSADVFVGDNEEVYIPVQTPYLAGKVA